jgi:hypothetical protein
MIVGGCEAESSAASKGAPVTMIRDAEAGAGYSSAGPRRCPSKKAPAKGPPTRDQVAAYVICGRESESGTNLRIVGDITITDIAPGRRYNYRQDNNVPNIDTTKLVYAIRGRLQQFSCNRTDQVGDYGPKYKPGTNCSLVDHIDATGLCYQDTFGSWDCKLSDFSAKYPDKNFPAPS